MQDSGKKKWTSYILVFLFAAFIWGYSAVDLLVPNREYSEMENRYLAQAPTFSFRSLLNNSYALKTEEFTNDQFFLRDGWITLKSLCETALGKIENNGIAYGKDGYMFEKRAGVDMEQLNRNVNSVLEFAGRYEGENITLMLAPTSDMVLTDKLPKGLGNLDQKPVIDDIYERAEAAGMKTVDVRGALKATYDDYLQSSGQEHRGAYIYYRTDHHWTTYGGAYVAYAEFMKTAGLGDAAQLQTPFETRIPNFYGTYYSKAKLYSAKPDEIIYYEPKVKSVTINGEEKDGLYDFEKFKVRDKYAAFLHGNNAITVIESDDNQNHIDGEKTTALVFKDSFGNSFAPFLCYSFDEITVVDLRYFKDVKNLMETHDYDRILLLYSFPSFAQETSIANIKL